MGGEGVYRERKQVYIGKGNRERWERSRRYRGLGPGLRYPPGGLTFLFAVRVGARLTTLLWGRKQKLFVRK